MIDKSHDLPVIWLAFAMVMGSLLPSGHSRAALAPRSPEELFSSAQLVVTGKVIDLTITSERSRIETGFGNYDWLIDLTIRVEQVDKGELAVGEEVSVRCFRIRSRKSMTEYFSPVGHSPIPGVGTNVRVYLKNETSFLSEEGPSWWVILPNGIDSADDVALEDAPEVASLSSGYTYLLPLGGWILLLTVVVIISLAVSAIAVIRRVLRGRAQTDSALAGASPDG